MAFLYIVMVGIVLVALVALLVFLIWLMVREEDRVEYVLKNFSSMGLEDWQRVEGAAMGSRDKGLLYALRVSSVVPRLVKVDVLAGRWNVAAGGWGLGRTPGARRAGEVREFLRGLYLAKLGEMLEGDFQKTRAKWLDLKTVKARENLEEKWRERMTGFLGLFEAGLAEAEGMVAGARDRRLG